MSAENKCCAPLKEEELKAMIRNMETQRDLKMSEKIIALSIILVALGLIILSVVNKELVFQAMEPILLWFDENRTAGIFIVVLLYIAGNNLSVFFFFFFESFPSLMFSLFLWHFQAFGHRKERLPSVGTFNVLFVFF